jgi:hypothetical protein
LIQQEQEWRRPPEPQKLASGKDAQVVLASWSNSLFIGGKKLRAGSVPAGTTFIAGPIPRRCSTVFF